MTAAAPREGRLERRQLAELQPHPQAGEIPPPSAGEIAALKDDLARRGQQQPLEITVNGVILDGHVRHRLLQQLAVDAASVLVVEPADELEHMLLAALRRRQLTASQAAAIAVKVADIAERRDAARSRSRQNLRQGPERATLPVRGEQISEPAGRTRDLISELCGASARTVEDVLTVAEHDPALFDRVLAGSLSANVAASKVRRARRDAQLPAAPPLPDGPFGLMLADPPWTFGSPDGEFAPEKHYPCMPTADIKALPVPAADDCILFLWAVNALLPDALAVMHAWGFSYKTNLVWVKTNGIGPGVWLRHRHELLLVGTRGHISPPDPPERVDSVIEAPRRDHSEKPLIAYQRIEQMYPQLSKLELFARNGRPGWHSWGNQAPATEDEAT